MSEGKCFICGNKISRKGAIRHIKSCLAKNMKDEPRTLLYQIFITDVEFPEYWLIIEMRGDAILEHLDMFLRDIWVECCGHLSEFIIAGKHYEPKRQMEYRLGFTPYDIESMDIPIREVLNIGTRFRYIYDFGTTTELELKVISTRMGSIRKNIRLLARNYPPKRKCAYCGEEAEYLCGYCLHERDEVVYLCKKCLNRHRHENYGPIKLVNSPRLTKCGYEESPLVKIFRLYEY